MLRAATCLDRVKTPGIHLIRISLPVPVEPLQQETLSEKGSGKGAVGIIVYMLLGNYFTCPPTLAINRQITSLETLKAIQLYIALPLSIVKLTA